MTASALLPTGGGPPQRGAPMVLDVESARAGIVADLIATASYRAESSDQKGDVHR